MANPNTKFGLRPSRTVSGSPYSGSANAYSTAAGYGTALFLGDPVKLIGTGQQIGDGTYGDVQAAATGDVILGVVVGSIPLTRDSAVYREASTQRLVLVCDDPNMLFEIQETSGGTAVAVNDIGLNANFIVATGSTTTGRSGVELDNSTPPNTTNTFDLKIVGLQSRADVAQGANAKWLVRINRHLYANQIAGV